MHLSRRSFLVGSSLAALAGSRLVSARGLVTEPTLDDILKRALAAATKAGATYADIRIVRHRHEAVRDARGSHRARVVERGEYGLGVRVIAGGAWGFSATPIVSSAEAERVARTAVDIASANAPLYTMPVTLAPVPANVDVWQTPLIKDPFKIPLEDKAELLLAINREAMKVPGVKFATASYRGTAEWKLFASTDGAYVEQELVRVGPGYSVTAVDAKHGEFETVGHTIAPRQAGWEYVEAAPLVADARQVAEHAVEKLKAASVEPGKRDLVLDPTHLWLTIHESIGHSTELDRALGYEANFMGTSFATPGQARQAPDRRRS